MPRIITILLLLTTLSAGQVMADEMQTRFGELTTLSRDYGRMIPQVGPKLNGMPVSPQIDGNFELLLIEKFQIGATDVVLVQDVGGTGCPVRYRFFTYMAETVTASPAFGSCSDLIKIKQNGEQITVTMPGFATARDEANMSAAQRKQLMETTKNYTYQAGVVYENGSPIK